MEPEEIGVAARRPGCQANSVFLWGVANFLLIGRNVLRAVDPSVDAAPNALDRAHTVLDFWARTSRAYRGGDPLHAAEVGARLDVFDEDTVSALVAAGAELVNADGPGQVGPLFRRVHSHTFPYHIV